jgi:hypothetical protein
LQTVSTQFELELKKRLREEIVRLSDVLIAGTAITDYPKYQNIVGQISALGRVTETYCDEVTTTINEQR